jgi:hypothetical protein
MTTCDANVFGCLQNIHAAMRLFSAALFQLFDPILFRVTRFCSNLSLRSAERKKPRSFN